MTRLNTNCARTYGCIIARTGAAYSKIISLFWTSLKKLFRIIIFKDVEWNITFMLFIYYHFTQDSHFSSVELLSIRVLRSLQNTYKGT